MGQFSHPFTDPPAWALTLGQIGASLVWAAATLFLLAAIANVRDWKGGWAKVARLGLSLGSVSLFGAIAIVATLFIKDQYEFRYVFNHGARDLELMYKFAGVWSGQEGSW